MFAFNATTGKKYWDKEILLNKGHGTFEIQPQVADGRVYLANQYGSGSGGGVLLALNAPNGALLWKFNTIGDAERGVDAIGSGSGGSWERPLVGTDGWVTFGIGHPYLTAASAIAYPSTALRNWVCLLINVATMPNGHHHDQEDSIIDGVNDPIITNPESVTVTTSKRPRRRRAWILGKESNRSLKTRLGRTINLAKFAKRRRSEFNPVETHDQPRSVFTCSQGILSPTSDRDASKAATS